MNNDWNNVTTVAAGAGAIDRYWVSWAEDPGALVIQVRIVTGAVVRHLFPRGSIEAVTSMTMRETHRVCINPTFMVDSVIFDFGSAEDALMFHWRVVDALPHL